MERVKERVGLVLQGWGGEGMLGGGTTVGGGEEGGGNAKGVGM